MKKIQMFSLFGLGRLAGDSASQLSLEKIDLQRVSKTIGWLKRFCDYLDLPVSSKLISRHPNPQSKGELEILLSSVRSEMESRFFLLIPSHIASFYDKDDFLTGVAATAFPNSQDELRLAGTCFALGQNTACVFHCMRALEYGLGALAKEVGVTFDIQNWQNVLDQIAKAKEERARTLSRGPEKNEQLQFLSEAIAEFRHFKDGWRNYVSHNKIKYDESQAQKVLEHVASFIEILSAHLKE